MHAQPRAQAWHDRLWGAAGACQGHTRPQRAWTRVCVPAAAGAAFLLWECSTPFVYARWFLFTLGRAGTRAYVANGLAMLASFFIFRNVLGVGARPACTWAPFLGFRVLGFRI